jgi:hypothetical protein
MYPTVFGVLVVAIGLLLLVRSSMTAMLSFTMFTTLMGGSAALALPSLGGSSIPPADLALVFLMLRAILPGPGQMAALGPSLRANGFLVVFVLYGSASAWLLPKLFQNAAEVTPLRPGAVRQLYEVAPIHFSSQNITTSVYLMGTLAAGLGAYIGAARPGAARTILRIGIAITIIHASLGFLSVVAPGTPLQTVIEAFRNGHYAQLDQNLSGVSRMNGIWPEASGFAAYGCGWFIFMTELWLRRVQPRMTGPAAAYMGLALAASTSSTAYVGLAGYAMAGILRSLLLPGSISGRKILVVAACGFGIVTLAATLMVVAPPVLATATKILRIMTVDKADSSSGLQRLFWAKQGLEAFFVSWGLGIGAGTFRSSSLIMAILGSMGVIGIVAFAGHMLRVFKPLRASTHFAPRDLSLAVGIAASWAAVLMLMPAAVSSPSPDPGIVWAIFAGIALALRSAPTRRTATPPDRQFTTMSATA